MTKVMIPQPKAVAPWSSFAQGRVMLAMMIGGTPGQFLPFKSSTILYISHVLYWVTYPSTLSVIYLRRRLTT